MKLLRYYHTLKYLKLIQITGRVWYFAKKKLHRFIKPVIKSLTSKYEVSQNEDTGKLFAADPIIVESVNCHQAMLGGSFTFLNKTSRLGFPPAWQSKYDSLLWQFNLHYFHYVPLLSDSERELLCRNWIENNTLGYGVGWHPYVISLRICNWIKWVPGREDIDKSLYTQSIYLLLHLENFHPSNHFLENAKALVFSGIYFKNQLLGARFFRKGMNILLKELPKQVEEDGAYFERSPMYHNIILEGLLDIMNVISAHNRKDCSALAGSNEKYDAFYNLLYDSCQKMALIAEVYEYPDGTLPLFNDSANGISATTSQLLEYSQKLGIQISGKSNISDGATAGIYGGFFIFKNETIAFCCDVGEISPSFNPAHSHSNIFSYELFVSGEKIVADPGVFEYKDGEARNYFRSTRAHNTVTIDKTNQAECWGSFRVGRRYPPKNVTYSVTDDGFRLIGEFHGYSHLIGDGLVHKREIEYSKENQIILVRDSISGNGNHISESRFTLTPSTEVIPINSDSFTLNKNGISISLKTNTASITREGGWYSPEFGVKHSTTAITLRSDSLPAVIEYSLKISREVKGV